MEDLLQGGRDEMRGFGVRAGFTTFARFSPALFVCLVVLFCLFWFFVCGFSAS